MEDIEVFRCILEYRDGVLYWSKDSWNRRFRGKPAGNVNKAGYVDISYKNKRYYAHRIIFALFNNRWPSKFIDHIDGHVANNRIENLREADKYSNSYNSKKNTRNTTGIKGVSRHSGGWHAEISANKTRYRKWFKSKQKAINWVSMKRIELHGEYARNS